MVAVQKRRHPAEFLYVYWFFSLPTGTAGKLHAWKLGVFQRPLTPILLQKHRDTNGRCIVIQIGGVYSTVCQREGILLQKYRDRNGMCIAMLFKSIGVRGRFDSRTAGEFHAWNATFRDRPPALVQLVLTVLVSGLACCWVSVLSFPRTLRLGLWTSILLYGLLGSCLDLLPTAPLPLLQQQDAQHKFFCNMSWSPHKQIIGMKNSLVQKT